jgi:cyclin A
MMALRDVTNNVNAAAPVVAAALCAPADSDFTQDIYNHLFERQLTSLRDAKYIARQPEVQERMRVILVDWLVDVALKFKHRPETFFLAVDIVDRYLMLQPVSRGNLQLVGITAVLIAAKHEEIWAPEVRECVQITANTYTREDIIRVERDVAAALRFRFTLPTSFQFAARLQELAASEMRVHPATEHLAMFFLELSAVHYGMLPWHPSTVALAAFLLGRITNEHRRRVADGEAPVVLSEGTDSLWLPRFLDEPSRVFCRITSTEELAPPVRELLRFAIAACEPDFRFKAVQRKYATERFLCVAREPVCLPVLADGAPDTAEP